MDKKLNFSEIASREIHGQKLFFLSNSQWQTVFKCSVMRFVDTNRNLEYSFSESLLKIIKNDLLYITRFKELDLAIGLVNNFLLLPYVIFRKNSIDYRIILEKITCKSCSSKVVIGNAFIMDNYLGISNHFDEYKLRREARELQIHNCPNCNNELSRPAIWINQLDQAPEFYGNTKSNL